MYLLTILALLADPPTDQQVLRTLPRQVTALPLVATRLDDMVIVKNETVPQRWECVVHAKLVVDVPLLKLKVILPVMHRVVFSPHIAGSGTPLGYL